MFEEIVKFFKRLIKADVNEEKSKNAAKERLHLVLTQDRANVSADFLAMMKQEIIEVIKKYIDIDENAIDVRLTNKPNEDGTVGSPTLYANIPIISVKNDVKTSVKKNEETEENKEEKAEENNNEEKKENENPSEETKSAEGTEKKEETEQPKEVKENEEGTEQLKEDIEKTQKPKENKKEEIKKVESEEVVEEAKKKEK